MEEGYEMEFICNSFSIVIFSLFLLKIKLENDFS